MAKITLGDIGVNMNEVDLTTLADGLLAAEATETALSVSLSGGGRLTLGGAGFNFGPSGTLTGGTIESLTETADGVLRLRIEDLSLSFSDLAAFLDTGDMAGLRAEIFSGDDVITGGAQADTLFGGDGRDTADYSGAGASIMANLAAGSGYRGEAFGDVYDGIENLTGSRFADDLVGDAGANVLQGNDGVDTLMGLAGEDVLLGGAGDDLIYGDDTTMSEAVLAFIHIDGA